MRTFSRGAAATLAASPSEIAAYSSDLRPLISQLTSAAIRHLRPGGWELQLSTPRQILYPEAA